MFSAKWMLEIPDALSMTAKLRSAKPSTAMPSRTSLSSATPNNSPDSLLQAEASSFHASSNWSVVRWCCAPYKRMYFNRMLRLRANARAAATESVWLMALLPLHEVKGDPCEGNRCMGRASLTQCSTLILKANSDVSGQHEWWLPGQVETKLAGVAG